MPYVIPAISVHVPPAASTCSGRAPRRDVVDFRFSSDGSLLVTADRRYVGSIETAHFEAWDLRTLTSVLQVSVPRSNPSDSEIWIDQRNMLLRAGQTTRLIRMTDGGVLATYDGTVLAMAGDRPRYQSWPSRAVVGLRSTIPPDPEAKRFFVYWDKSGLDLRSTIDGSLIAALDLGPLNHPGRLHAAFTADERMLIVADGDRTRIWRVPEGIFVADLDVGEVKQSRGGSFLVGSRDRMLLLWKLPEVTPLPPIPSVKEILGVEIDRTDTEALVHTRMAAYVIGVAAPIYGNVLSGPHPDDEPRLIKTSAKGFFEAPLEPDMVTISGSLWLKEIRKPKSFVGPVIRGFRVWTEQFHDFAVETSGEIGEMALTATPDGRTVIAGVTEPNGIWLLRLPELPMIVDLGEPVTRLDVAPDGATLVAVLHDDSIRVWKLPEAAFLGCLGQVGASASFPSGQQGSAQK